jgi:hypothetical protein
VILCGFYALVFRFSGWPWTGSGLAVTIRIRDLASSLNPFSGDLALLGQEGADESDHRRRPGKIPTTSVRRRISLSSRSWRSVRRHYMGRFTSGVTNPF